MFEVSSECGSNYESYLVTLPNNDATTHSIMPQSIMPQSIISFSIMPLSIIPVSIMTLGIMSLSKIPLGLNAAQLKCHTE